ncbi:uncharacterized protein [Littorina saxatilis]|uniref:J domain-containing protein n=1 Tax=Littorina saxatilis TaxID=31220 RepID=A0AAN9GBT9_9CAEN
MADDERGPPSPLGGAAMRQSQRRDHSLFPGPPSPMEESSGLWTQFSGMPQQPGSPTSLHQWLHSVDDSAMSGNGTSGGTYPPRNSSSTSGSRSSPLDKFAADFVKAGIGQGDTARSPPMHSALGHHFDFMTSRDLGSQNDFGSSPDFGAPHQARFSRSPFSSPSAGEMAGLPPDLSQPPPDLSFAAQPDFSRPPPSFVPDVPLLHPAADPHCSLADFLAAHSQQSYSPQEVSMSGDRRLPSPLSGFDASSLGGQSLPRPRDIIPGHVDVSLPPPNFMPFTTVGDDVFHGSVDFDNHERNNGHSVQKVVHTQKKMVRQNSEPLHSRTVADEGKAMYVEALRRLNSFGPSGPSYEPFGSTALQQEDAAETASTLSDDSPSLLQQACIKEPSKLSYSDVTKTSKGKLPQAKGDAVSSDKEPEGFPKASSDPAASKQSRHQGTKRQQFSHTRIVNQRGRSGQSDNGQGTFTQPNSRYGLDHFDDMADFVRAEQRSSSAESLNSHHVAQRSLNSQCQQAGVQRRNSNSSISSGTSAVEDGHVTKSSGASSSEGRSSRCRDRSANLNGKEAGQDSAGYFNASSGISTSTPSSRAQQQPPQSKSSSNPAAGQKVKNDKLFFDPKRIFQSRSSSKSQESPLEKGKASEDKGCSSGEGFTKEETILNNGKPNNTTTKASAAAPRKADYINNDLREGGLASIGGGGGGGGKRTNQTAAFNRHGSRKHGSKDSVSQNGSGADRSKGGESRGRRQDSENDDHSFIRNIDWVLVDEWMKYISDCSMTFARNSFSAIVTLLVYLLGVIMYLAMGAIHLIALSVSKVWSLIRSRIFKDQGAGSWGNFAASSDAARRRFGVEENITLPSTGEEAMKRLLACKGKDPYSILGLRADATDEDIKRYYRRQAVLVHPDKNQEPGAEEAFKILGHSFEMIGEPAKRKEYDAHIFETSEAEAAMREFSDLLTKLQEKVQEAANLMRCDHCGGKHRRIPVERAWYSARFCDRCNIHHSAKEGDVWAESSMLGFLWHYYACMENNIYDITEWVSCQRENFKHMKANAHPVFYRIQTDGNRRHRQGQSGEADLEDFINRLFNKTSMPPEGASAPGWQFPSQQAGGATSQSGWGNPAAAASASSSKRSRRKKKRN